jgi:hypothetical protein
MRYNCINLSACEDCCHFRSIQILTGSHPIHMPPHSIHRGLPCSKSRLMALSGMIGLIWNRFFRHSSDIDESPDELYWRLFTLFAINCGCSRPTTSTSALSSYESPTSIKLSTIADPCLPHPTHQTFSFLVLRALPAYDILMTLSSICASVAQWLMTLILVWLCNHRSRVRFSVITFVIIFSPMVMRQF